MSNLISESQNPERDAQVIACVEANSVRETAVAFGLSEGAIRRILRREKAAKCYALTLTDGMQCVAVGEVRTSQGFIHACKKAIRTYSGTFSRLELPQWKLVSGEDSISLVSEELA